MKKVKRGTSLVVQQLGPGTFTAKAQVQSLVWELRSCKKIKGKRKPTKWNKIFVTHVSDTGLVFRIYKLLSQLKSKNINNTIKKEQSIWIVISLKKIYKWASKHMKRYSTSSPVRKMRIKTTMRYHFTPIRMAIIYIYMYIYVHVFVKHLYRYIVIGREIATHEFEPQIIQTHPSHCYKIFRIILLTLFSMFLQWN